MMLLCLILLTALAIRESASSIMGCEGKLQNFDGKSRVHIYCTDHCKTSKVWGTCIYTEDSPACAACSHAGVIYPGVNHAIMEEVLGVTSFEASKQNGIQSLSYNIPMRAMRCLPSPGGPMPSDCSDSANEVEQNTFLIQCPPGCLDHDRNFWGTVNYTSDSSFCYACAHSGVLTNEGGVAMINKLPGQSSYEASTQNGLTSKSNGKYKSSYNCQPPSNSAAATTTTDSDNKSQASIDTCYIPTTTSSAPTTTSSAPTTTSSAPTTTSSAPTISSPTAARGHLLTSEGCDPCDMMGYSH